MKTLAFLIVYGLVLIFHLYALVVDDALLAMISKPALLGLLILFFTLSIRKRESNRFGWLMLGGLVLSLMGDVFLMFDADDNSYFIYGLGSFLLAHIFYAIAFTRTYLSHHTIPLLKRHGWVMIGIVAYGLYFFSLIKNYLGDMLGPVLIYTLVITVMLLMAFNRYEKVGSKSFWSIAAGAVLFAASDSLLAWNKFVEPLEFGDLAVMGTYGLAQLGITLGAVFQMKEMN